VAVSPDGAAVYVTCYGSQNVYQVLPKTNPVATSLAVGVQPLGVVVSPDGALVYVASSGGGQPNSSNVAVLQTRPVFRVNALIPGSSLDTDPTLLAVLAPMRWLFVVGGLGNVAIVNMDTNQIVGDPFTLLASLQGPMAAATTPDGKRLFVSDTQGVVAVVRTSPTFQVIATLSVGK
jgi:YVTN family beta-propeller protein